MKRWKPEIKGNNGQEVFLYPDHRKPMTRREFLAAGLIDSAMFVTAPTLLGLFAKNAHAAGPAKLLVLNIDMAGGSSIAGGGNLFVPRTIDEKIIGSQALISRGVMQNPSEAGVITTQFGAEMFTGNAFFQQINTRITDPAIRNGLKFVAIPCQLGDDGPNQVSPANYINAAVATIINETYPVQSGSQIGGSVLSGHYQTAPPMARKHEPFLSVVNGNAVRAAISSPFAALRPAQGERVMATLSQLADEKVKAGATDSSVAAVLKKGFDKNLNNIRTAASIVTDPRAAMGGLSPVTIAKADAAALGSEGDRLLAAVHAAVTGISRPVINITMGGADYHDGTLTGGLQFALRVGAIVDIVTSEAKERGIPLFINSVTDGGQRYQNGVPTGDDGRYSTAWMAAYLPNRTVEVQKSYLGAADPNSGFALTNNLTGGNGKMIATSILGNFVAVMGQAGLTNITPEQMQRQIIGDSNLGRLTDAQLRSLLGFKG